jgi:UDP-N-acetylmuramate dehydrogenase
MHTDGVHGMLRPKLSLASRTTLELGGPARYFLEVDRPGLLEEALRWARDEGIEVMVLGGGSNVVVADSGYDGLVLGVAWRGVEVARQGDTVLVTAAAGECWDELVGWAVGEGFAGLECLSGIPGTVGATPIQNVGAYGQDVASVIDTVEVLDRARMVRRTLSAAECSFGYRHSLFRTEPDRFIVLAVRFRLTSGGKPVISYPELARVVKDGQGRPSLGDVRAAVLALRRAKSMTLEPDDPDRRSVGSFFVNPVLAAEEAERVAALAAARGMLAAPDQMPCFALADGTVKVPAAWLIEHAGIRRGWRRGNVGVSSRHSLALVHHGGGSTAELLQLAADIRDRVVATFGVWLRPEPVFVGFAEPDPLLPPTPQRS